jgi:transposase
VRKGIIMRDMGRHRTQLNLSPSQVRSLRQLLQSSRDTRTKERLQFALRAATGRETLEDLAQHIGRSRSTIQNWLVKFEAGGITGLLDRDTPPGMASPVASQTIQARIEAGVKTGRWRSASEIAAWLKREHGIKRSRKSIYYWLNKCNAPTRDSTNNRAKLPKNGKE